MRTLLKVADSGVMFNRISSCALRALLINSSIREVMVSLFWLNMGGGLGGNFVRVILVTRYRTASGRSASGGYLYVAVNEQVLLPSSRC